VVTPPASYSPPPVVYQTPTTDYPAPTTSHEASTIDQAPGKTYQAPTTTTATTTYYPCIPRAPLFLAGSNAGRDRVKQRQQRLRRQVFTCR
jgi:hypothetical protein